MHLKWCYIFRVYSRGREVHGWIVPYHIQVCVYLSSPQLPYIIPGVCVCPRLRVKKLIMKKKREGPRSKVYTSMCVCVCACTSNKCTHTHNLPFQLKTFFPPLFLFLVIFSFHPSFSLSEHMTKKYFFIMLFT